MATILGSELMAADIDRKHDKMHASAFVFFRATYWRWAETILDICPELADAPSVLAVGDIHLENYGTWRDAEGRLAWGVNDSTRRPRPRALPSCRAIAKACARPNPCRSTATTPGS